MDKARFVLALESGRNITYEECRTASQDRNFDPPTARMIFNAWEKGLAVSLLAYTSPISISFHPQLPILYTMTCVDFNHECKEFLRVFSTRGLAEREYYRPNKQ